MKQKRIELSVHTNMSAMDGVDSAEKLLIRAAELGLYAIAVTDRNVVQAFPEAEKAVERLTAQGHGIRVLYGMDADFTDGGRAFQMTILAQTHKGLKNLYRLVTICNTKDIGKAEPQISKDELTAHRFGLLFGSGGLDGELMQAVASGQPWSRLCEMAKFYDYLEIQPFLDKEINRTVVRLGEALNIPVCATGNVYFCSPEDEICRHILHSVCANADAEDPMPFYLRSTDEMLADFAYLGAETAYEVVVENPSRIAERIEQLRPIPQGFFPPKFEGARQRLKTIVFENAKKRYGDPLPSPVRMRLEKELTQIAEHGYEGIYLTLQMLTADSERHGYHVLSRGSVGASLVAHLAGITEVDPLPPHYVCPHCRCTEFLTDGEVGSGFDLPEKVCPQCGIKLDRDGQDIPFEVFAGLNGEKVPNIDLNIAYEYYPSACAFLQSLFGKDHVLKAGIVSTVSRGSATQYVRRYAKKHSLELGETDIMRLSKRLCRVKRKSEQHPVGWILIPADHDVEDFTAVQNDLETGCLASHFDFHGLSGLFKLDLIENIVPEIYRELERSTGIPITDVPMSDQEIYSLLTSPKALGVTPEEIDCETGTLGLWELELDFIRRMMIGMQPKNFSDLMKILGLAHGTDTWADNVQKRISEGTSALSDVIALRDDVMLYLMRKGFPREAAYEIMETVYKRRSPRFSPEIRQKLLDGGASELFLDSCEKIGYLFPKAHAAAYMMAAVRLGWYKIHYPAAFYAACFNVCFGQDAEEGSLDLSVLLKGAEELRRSYTDPEETEDDIILSEPESFYHLAYEAVQRGVPFLPTGPGDNNTSCFYAENGAIRIRVVN